MKQTNPIGAGTKNLCVNLPTGMHEKIKQLAKDSGKKRSDYIRGVLLLAMSQNVRVNVFTDNQILKENSVEYHVTIDKPIRGRTAEQKYSRSSSKSVPEQP